MILITIASDEIIQTTKNMDINISCYNQKLAMVNKFAVGDSKKLIECLKARAAKNQVNLKIQIIFTINYNSFYFF